MVRTLVVLGVVSVSLVACGLLLAADTKSRQLPPNWTKLGLSDQQAEKVVSIRASYKAQTDKLREQIRELEKKERAELEKVLTAAQKERLREILEEKTGGKE